MDASSLYSNSRSPICNKFNDRPAPYSLVMILALALITASCLSFLNLLSIPNVSNQIVGPLFSGIALVCLVTITTLCKRNKSTPIENREQPFEKWSQQFRARDGNKRVPPAWICADRIYSENDPSYISCMPNDSYMLFRDYHWNTRMIYKDSQGKDFKYEDKSKEFNQIIKDKWHRKLVLMKSSEYAIPNCGRFNFLFLPEAEWFKKWE